jgi:hypothetical protein
MKGHRQSRRPRPEQQCTFEFFERTARRERWFKDVIVAATVLASAVVVSLVPWSRYRISSLPSLASRVTRSALGIATPRAEIDEEWRRSRVRGIAESHQALVREYRRLEPAYQGLLRYAGLDPDHGLLRWGNFDRTLLLPSSVFEPDDTGRAYRLRPCVESIWLRQVTIQGVLPFFLVRDRPDLHAVIRGTTAIPVEQSRQSTNTWGLRGPEPDPGAPLRGIVLGDSFMQGLFVGDDETPPECLKRRLETEIKTKASVLNTGHLGYSPEQFYYSLLAFADRFPAHFVVVSVCANDFGDLYEVLSGKGDWDEGKYWLDKINVFCARRSWPCLIVPVPFESQMFGRRKSGGYPGAISNILNASAMTFLDPTDAFINAHLELMNEAQRRGERPYGCPLFNDHIHDGHFSALGAEVWAGAVGRRVRLLLDCRNPKR